MAAGFFGGATAAAAVTPVVTASIPVGYDPVAVAVDPSTHTAYVVNEGVLADNPSGMSPAPGSVSVIDGAGPHQVIATITAGIGNPTSVAVDPTTHDVYIADGTSVAVIDGNRDAQRDTIIATIDEGPHPTLVALDSSTHNLYVTDASSMSVIDGSNHHEHDQVMATVAVPGALAVAVDPSTHVAYAATSHSVYAIDRSENGRRYPMVATIGGVGGGYSLVVAGDPSSHAVYVADSGGRVSVIDGSPGDYHNQVVAKTLTYAGSLTAVAVDPSTHAVYVMAFTFTYVRPALLVIDNATADVSLTISGPTTATFLSTFAETVTVTNNGPDLVPNFSTVLVTPSGLEVSSAPGATGGGATTPPSPLEWTDTNLASGSSVTHVVTFTADGTGAATLGGIVTSSIVDPNPYNNDAFATVEVI